MTDRALHAMGAVDQLIGAYADRLTLNERLEVVEPLVTRIEALMMEAVRAARDEGVAEGRRQAAEAIRAADTSGWPGGRGGDVDECQELAAAIAEAVRP